MKFTKGPWIIGGENSAQCTIEILDRNPQGDAELIASVSKVGEQAEANARLIASSPLLYTTLKAIADIKIDDNTNHAEVSAACIVIAKTAIESIENRS